MDALKQTIQSVCFEHMALNYTRAFHQIIALHSSRNKHTPGRRTTRAPSALAVYHMAFYQKHASPSTLNRCMFSNNNQT